MIRLAYILTLTLLFTLPLSAQEKIRSKVKDTDTSITVSTLTTTPLSSNLSSSISTSSGDYNGHAQIATLLKANPEDADKYFLLQAVTEDNFGFLCEVEATRRIGGRTRASFGNAIGNLHSTKYLWTLEKADAENTYYIRNALGEYLPKVPSDATEDIVNPSCVSSTDRGVYQFVQHWGSDKDNTKWGIKSVDNSAYYVQYNSYTDKSAQDEINLCVIRSKDERNSISALTDASCVKFYIYPVVANNLDTYDGHVADLLREFRDIYSHFNGNERYIGALSKDGQALLEQEIKYYSQAAHQNDFIGARNALVAVNNYKNLPDPNKKYIIESAYSGFTGGLQAILEYDNTSSPKVLKWRELTSATTHTTNQLFQFEKISSNIVGDVSGAGLYRIKCYGTSPALYLGHASWNNAVSLKEKSADPLPTEIPRFDDPAVFELVEKENIPGQFSLPARYLNSSSVKDYSTLSVSKGGPTLTPSANGSAVVSTYNGNWFSVNQSNCFYIREAVELPALQPYGDGSYVSTYTLDADFKIPEGVKAWTIDSNTAPVRAGEFLTVTYSEVSGGSVSANSGVLLTAESSISSYSSPCYLIEKHSASSIINSNALFGVTDRTLVNGYMPVGWGNVVDVPYALANKDGIVAFYPYQPLSGFYAPNHAYLDLSKLGVSSVSGARPIVLLPFDEAPTAITTPHSSSSDNTLYNILGQRITLQTPHTSRTPQTSHTPQTNYRGIVIKNGKKIFTHF